MPDLIFVTGNQQKADFLAKYLNYPVVHKKIDLVEIQSLDLKEIVEHKVRQAYEVVKAPVIVEDVSLEFSAFGKIPGPFIKYFLDQIGSENICRMVDGLDRSALGRCMFGYYDGDDIHFFEGKLPGKISQHPEGENGYGWDEFFIPEGYSVTRGSLNQKDYEDVYRKIRPLDKIKDFLENK